MRGFFAVRTQWITGAGGATGLDYVAVERKIARLVRREGLSQEEEDRVLDDIDVIEGHVLAEWGRESERRNRELDRRRTR